MEQIVGREIVEARGGIVRTIPLVPGVSTTSLSNAFAQPQPNPILFMNTSAAISALRQSGTRILSAQAGGLAAQSVNVLVKYASLPRGSARLSR